MDAGLKKFTIHVAKSPFSNEKEKQKAYKQVFSSELGGKVLQDILKDAGWFRPFIPNGSNPDNASASTFDQGKKFVCYTILNTMTVRVLSVDMTKEVDNYETEGVDYD
jgi:hypothetical protein